MSLRVTHCLWHEQEPVLRALRRLVFIEEQGVDEALEWEAADLTAAHFLAWQGSEPIGTARLLPLDADQGKLTRMAVLAPFRQQGVGRALVQRVEAYALAEGLRALQLDAQLQALGFYSRLGYSASGEVFWDAGIAHRRMHKTLLGDAAC
jgi:predicted GNAT family N-acyltransferase